LTIPDKRGLGSSMKTDNPPRRSLLTPTRVVMVLAWIVALLCGAVFAVWLTSPWTVTLEIVEPVGKKVVCHLVVEGQPESRAGIAPVTYRFEANEVQYAVICLDPTPPSDVSVSVHDGIATWGPLTGEGVKGSLSAGWWGYQQRFEIMTPAHVATMRKSVLAEREADASSDAP